MTEKKQRPAQIRNAEKIMTAVRNWRRFLPLGLVFGVPQILRGENQVAYRYEFYSEDNNRMQIETHSVYFEQKLLDNLTAKGELIYDGISGATPKGTYFYPPANGKIFTTKVFDIRRAYNLSLNLKLKNHTISAGVAESKEHDYLSRGISLGDAIEFNDKNTVLHFGVSHNFDSVRHANQVDWSPKDSTEAIVGISQLLSPKTIASADFTFGYEEGFLSDPYRQAEFIYAGHPFGSVRSEIRPSQRTKEVGLLRVTQYFDSLNASLEGSYRFYHDSYGIAASTIGLTWHQWLGKRLIVEPGVRFYQQGAASFYQPLFNVNPATAVNYSSDYRLSEFYSLDFGAQLTVIITDWLRVNGGFHRYEMHGLDQTAPAMYPKANVFTVGVQFLW